MAAKATAETIVGECHLEGFKSESGLARESKATQLRKSAPHAQRPRAQLPGGSGKGPSILAHSGGQVTLQLSARQPGQLQRVVRQRRGCLSLPHHGPEQDDHPLSGYSLDILSFWLAAPSEVHLEVLGISRIALEVAQEALHDLLVPLYDLALRCQSLPGHPQFRGAPSPKVPPPRPASSADNGERVAFAHNIDRC